MIGVNATPTPLPVYVPFPDTPYMPCSARLDAIVPVGKDRYGLVINTNTKAVGAVRVFLNGSTLSYAATFDSLTFTKGVGAVRFVTVPHDEITAAWVDSAGHDADHLEGCSVPSPSAEDDSTALATRSKTDGAAIRAALASPTTVAATEATGSCFQPNTNPRVVIASPIELDPATTGGAAGETEVAITLGTDSVQREIGVYQSSGYRQLDEIAVAVTARSRFVTTVRNCRPVVASYRFVVTFPKPPSDSNERQ